MVRSTYSKWGRGVLGLGLSAFLSQGLLAQQPPASGSPSDAANSKLSEPVFRVSKNAATPAGVPVNAPHPLDPALELARQSLTLMQSQINDYTAVLVKRERIDEELGENEFMFIKVRNRKVVDNNVVVPFSVYLQFLQPASAKGREVIYVENRNDGKLIAHEGGYKRMLGTHHLEPTGFLAMKGQRYPLTDIGLENLVVKLIERGEKDRRHGHCLVDLYPGGKVGGRNCTILRVVHPEKQPHFDFHIAEIFLDDEWKIPVRYIAFGWDKNDKQENEIIEEYTYQKIKINVGLTDKDFDMANTEYNFHRR
ncbi:MAG: DUF1571 domain-containing protein [Planctomycetota bacterium]|jgi:hypothetical protein